MSTIIFKKNTYRNLTQPKTTESKETRRKNVRIPQILFIGLTFLCMNHITLLTNAEQIPQPTLISVDEDDLTGDGLKETIKLKGTLFSQERNYFQNIWIELISKHTEKWRIPLAGGYEPKIHLVDLNHDNINDLFYQALVDEGNELSIHHLYTLKNGTIKEISLPKYFYLEGHFKEEFQIEIQTSIRDKKKAMIIDVKDRANEYIELDIYNEQGKLLSPMNASITPAFLYDPILISKSKGYGLKSFQKVTGANHTDILGTIETLWYFENGEWIILQTDWLSSN